jgi:gamma-glutamyl hercynylcysteine S-oxide synthase
MASTAIQPAAALSPEEQILGALKDARERTLGLVEHLDDEALTKIYSPIMSPLVWDLGHIAAYEDLWLAKRNASLELLRGDLAGVYDAFETPRAVRGDVEALGPADAKAYMREVRERVAKTIEERGVGDRDICEMVIRHELQHTETMRQTMAIASVLPPGEPPATAPWIAPNGARTNAGDWIAIEAGPFEMGAQEAGFAYDNERPRHTVTLDAFQIARQPVGATAWMDFVEDGGYRRREWWSDEGWAWKEEYDITHHPAIAAAAAREHGAGTAPACHVSWFEADAFARAHDARLPREAEWEQAATSGQPASPGQPDGTGRPESTTRSRLTAPRGEPMLAQVGRVWEWTGSAFGGYPGFEAYPYREYSEVFFGETYKVLRGGSWATDPRVKTVTFRNWDLPQRRQIFAGVRLARDGS